MLNNSGIKGIVDANKEELLAAIKAEDPKTAYDTQVAVRAMFEDFEFAEESVHKLKDYAFENGKWTLAEILDVGAIYFQDTALKALGFKVEDLNNKKK